MSTTRTSRSKEGPATHAVSTRRFVVADDCGAARAGRAVNMKHVKDMKHMRNLSLKPLMPFILFMSFMLRLLSPYFGHTTP
jgi:hypothetical protein